MDYSQIPEYENKKKYCRDCGKEIKFIKNQKTDKNMPVNVKSIKVVTSDGKVMQAYIPHWDVCTGSEKFHPVDHLISKEAINNSSFL